MNNSRIKRTVGKALCLLLAGIITVCASGCVKSPSPASPGTAPTARPTAGPASNVKTVNLMAGVTKKNTAEAVVPSGESAKKAADFAVRLFKACSDEEGNVLVSPLSVLAALSMTANGAEGETLREMEDVLGMSLEELNEFYYNYAAQLENGAKAKLALANSIWFTADERFTVNGDFLQKNADIFGADVFKAAFDEGTLNDINGWVNEHTDEMIPSILDRIPESAVMYLINALAFDAEWESIYEETEVHEGEFTLENGEKKTVEFMSSEEFAYLSSDNCEGFLKRYAGGRYAFAALLPNEGVTVESLVASLDGEKLMAMLTGVRSESVLTAIPKFETEYSAQLSEVLEGMGMHLAFNDAAADLSGLGASEAGNLYISRVLHKTYISVDERGTRAGAATAVEVCDMCMPFYQHSVMLDRPFLYMLIDTETNLPFFIGTMTDPS